MNRIDLINELKKLEYKKMSIQNAKRSVTVGGQRLMVGIEKGSEEYRFEGNKKALITYLEIEAEQVETEIQAVVLKLYPTVSTEPRLDEVEDADTGIF